MIEAKNLRKIYRLKKGITVKALDGVSLKLADTGMVFILGKSGSGKSTLLNVLGGLDSIDSGEIIIKGTSAKSFKQSHYDSYRNTYIGFIFQEYNILDELTVGANIALAIELQGRKATDREINSILQEVDLEGYGARKPNELSGGQKQRVAIARALVKRPEIIMADEPTGALDSATGKQVFDTLKKLSKTKLVLIVSHDREFSEQYADRIIELKDGVIISDVEKTACEEKDEAEANENLLFSDGEIKVRQGYTLTEEDRLAINSYLASLSADATILPMQASIKKKWSSKDFTATDESKILLKKDESFRLIKSKLSVKNAFKLGSSALKYKKIRLAVTVFLSLISFTLFGLADTIASYNSIDTAARSIADTGVNYASYVKSVKQVYDDYSYWDNYDNSLSPEELQAISAETGKKVIGVYKKHEELSFKEQLGRHNADGMNLQALYSSSFSGLVSIDNQLISDNGFRLLAGDLPQNNAAEIVITKYTYDYFAKAGYFTHNGKGEEKTLEITQPNDLIGKTLHLDISYAGTNDFKIVGIVDTGFDYSRYEKLADKNADITLNMIEMMALTEELDSARNYSFASVGFVPPAMIDDIISGKNGKAEQFTNGSVGLYLLKNDEGMSYDSFYGENGDNIISANGFTYVNSLNNVKNRVIWLGDTPLTELRDNQIIIPAEVLPWIILNSDMPGFWYNQEEMNGFEAIMLQNAGDWNIYLYSLHDFFDSIELVTACKYIYEHPEMHESIKQHFKDVYIAEGWSSEDAEMQVNQTNLYQLCSSRPDALTFVTNEMIRSYQDDIIARYDLEKYLISDEVQALLSSENYKENDLLFTFTLMERLDFIIAEKYADLHFEDARAYFILTSMNKEFDIGSIPKGQIISHYADFLMGKKAPPSDFIPSAETSYEQFYAETVTQLYKHSSRENKLVMECGFMRNSFPFLKNIEIVGILPNDEADTTSRWEGEIVLSESLIDQALGSNRGGIYSYALGTMPQSTAEIRELVKFSKTYTSPNGLVKYELVNNVMRQLSMVDDILEVLGTVFLYVGIGFALFASLMLANFISTSVARKKQDIGILRAIGSRSADVFRIFFAESFIIAMINYVLAMAGTITLTLIINNLLRTEAGLLITFISFGIRQVILLLGISLLVALIATFLPVKKIASLKPIDAIKNRK